MTLSVYDLEFRDLYNEFVGTFILEHSFTRDEAIILANKLFAAMNDYGAVTFT